MRRCHLYQKALTGAKPGFWRGGCPNLVPSLKRDPRVSPPEKFRKTYMRFDAIYYTYCTKIINLANFKVMFFSAFIRKKYLHLYKHIGN